MDLTLVSATPLISISSSVKFGSGETINVYYNHRFFFNIDV